MIKKDKIRVSDRKASIQISMPRSLLANIDNLRWRYRIEFFVCKIIREDIKVEKGDRKGRPLKMVLLRSSLYARTVAMAAMARLWCGQVLEFNYQH